MDVESGKDNRHTTLVRQARLLAHMEVRDAEASAYVARRGRLPHLRQRALQRRLFCCVLAMPCLFLGWMTIPFAVSTTEESAYLMTYLCTGLFLAGLGFAVGGYVVGESWKQAMRSMSEQEMMEKIEARTQEILAKELMTEEKEMEMEAAERQRMEREEMERERKTMEEEEIVRSIEREVREREEGGKGLKTRRMGSVSCTDIKVTERGSTTEEGKEEGKEGEKEWEGLQKREAMDATEFDEIEGGTTSKDGVVGKMKDRWDEERMEEVSRTLGISERTCERDTF